MSQRFAIDYSRKSWYNADVMKQKVVTGGKPFQSRLAPYEPEIRLRGDALAARDSAGRDGLAARERVGVLCR